MTYQPEHGTPINSDGARDTQSIFPAKVRITREIFNAGELAVLQMISDGYTNSQIADALKTSVRTIETRRANMMRKSNTTNTATLIKYAVKNNLVS